MDLFSIQDRSEISLIFNESSVSTSAECDATFVPDEEELYDSDTDSEWPDCSDSSDELVLGPASEHLPPGVEIDEGSDVESDDDDETDRISSTENHPVLCYKSQIMQLAQMGPPRKCPTCPIDEFVLSNFIVGSNMHLKWTCIHGHLCSEWSSQPLLRHGTNLGDLEFSSAILLSGNNFERIQRMCKFLKMPIVSKTSNSRFQSKYVIPAINKHWETVLAQNRARALGKDVIMLGDGRMDSPGFCAKYCTYVAMDYETNNILGLEIIDKREVSLKSPVMEMEGFKRTLVALESFQQYCSEICF